MRSLIISCLIFPALFILSCSRENRPVINVDAGSVRYRMAGGIGASWHAISLAKIDESPEYKWALRYPNSRGSAWGGNPPATDTSAWSQMEDHASWLGLSWIRVELSARMYEPERGVFDWENEEMRALYRILDWAEANGADVFLQQMWSNVKWNSYKDVQPLLSAPRSLNDFADGIAALLRQLTKEKKYTCIKYVCITNEPPGGSWGCWWSTGEKDAPLGPALKEVRKSLDAADIPIPVSGPDWTDLPAFDSAKIDFDGYIGAYDIHSYQGMDEKKEKILKAWADWARQHNKPLFLSELGDMRIGWGKDNPGPKSFRAALSNAETVLRGLNAGAGAFNRWSFTNRGDLDGQWQLIRTWDIKNQQYYDTIKPEPAAFYGYGILTRFMSKYSGVVQTEAISDTSLLSQTVINNREQLTTFILNKDSKPKMINLALKGNKSDRFYLYSVTEEEVTKPGFRMDPLKEFIIKDGGRVQLELPPASITALSNIHAMHDEKSKNR